MFTKDVAAGVHRIDHASTNCYLVEEGGSLTLVDAGLPRTWSLVDDALRSLGKAWSDIRAIVLTHAHFDHVGFAARAQREAGIPVWVHPGDEHLAAHPYHYKPGRARLLYPLQHPRSIPHLGAMTAAGALWVRGVADVRTFGDDEVLDVPGRLRAVVTPGHTDGHCALVLADRSTVFTGDGLVTLDPYTGRRGPRVVARAGTKDREQALASLEAIAGTGADTVLPGHGEPWTRGARQAAAEARAAGAA